MRAGQKIHVFFHAGSSPWRTSFATMLIPLVVYLSPYAIVWACRICTDEFVFPSGCGDALSPKKKRGNDQS